MAGVSITSDSASSEVFGQFKCCKTKNFNNFCCKVCFGIFHDSCISRRKGVVFVEGHLILCSKECMERLTKNEEVNKLSVRKLNSGKEIYEKKDEALEELKKKYEDDLKSLNKYTEELSLDNDNKDFYIKSLLKTIQDFEIQTNEHKQSITLRFDSQKKLINNLNKERNEILKVNEVMKVNLEDSLSQVRIFEERLKEFNEIRKDMLQTIKTLTEDNKVYASEVFKLKNKLAITRTDAIEDTCSNSNNSSINKVTNVDPNKTNSKAEGISRRKIMILSDEYGRYLDSFIKNKCNSVTTETIIKPGALFQNVIEDIVSLTRNYTLNDYVLIVAGTNDFKKMKYPFFKDIQSKIRYCTGTNIIFTSIPSVYCLRKYQTFVQKFNDKLSEYAFRLNQIAEGNVRCLDFCTKEGKLLKNILADKISMEFNNPRCHLKHLHFISSVGEYFDAGKTSESTINNASTFLEHSTPTKVNI